MYWTQHLLVMPLHTNRLCTRLDTATNKAGVNLFTKPAYSQESHQKLVDLASSTATKAEASNMAVATFSALEGSRL